MLETCLWFLKIWHQKPVPVSDASDMQFGTEFLWYQFLITNRTCSIFVPVYGTSFLVGVFSADFWNVCHGHNCCLHDNFPTVIPLKSRWHDTTGVVLRHYDGRHCRGAVTVRSILHMRLRDDIEISCSDSDWCIYRRQDVKAVFAKLRQCLLLCLSST